MAKEAGGVLEWDVSVFCLMPVELLMCKDGGFFETVHTTADLQVSVAFAVEVGWCKVVFVDDFLGDVSLMYAHVLENLHKGLEEEILDVTGIEASSVLGIRNHTIDVNLGISDADGRGANVLVCIKFIASDHQTDSINFGFVWPNGANKIGICDFLVMRDLGKANEENCDGANNCIIFIAAFGDTLGATSDFISKRFDPDGGVSICKKGIDVLLAASDGVVDFACNGGVGMTGNVFGCVDHLKVWELGRWGNMRGRERGKWKNRCHGRKNSWIDHPQN